MVSPLGIRFHLESLGCGAYFTPTAIVVIAAYAVARGDGLAP